MRRTAPPPQSRVETRALRTRSARCLPSGPVPRPREPPVSGTRKVPPPPVGYLVRHGVAVSPNSSPERGRWSSVGLQPERDPFGSVPVRARTAVAGATAGAERALSRGRDEGRDAGARGR